MILKEYTNQRIYILYCTALCLLLFGHAAKSQTYNAVDWGTYFNDNTYYPEYKYELDDLVDQLIVDDNKPENIYLVSQSKAPPKIDVSLCSGEIMDLGGGDGYVAKYNRCGDLVWSVYIGDFIQCIALDKENGSPVLYVAGKKGFVVDPVTAAACDGSSAPVFQPEAADKDDAFIAKFIDNGNSATLLRWSYFGGKTLSGNKLAPDNILGITVNRHKIFAVGTTKSIHLDTLAQQVGDSTLDDGGDAFFAVFDSLLSTLEFFSYIGGSGNDRCHDIHVYDNGIDPIDVFISGTTDSPSAIASGTGFDQTYNAGTDAFLCQWDDDDQEGVFKQRWGTYLGGTMYDHGRQMAVDADGNAFITLWGQSMDLPVTEKAFDKNFGIPGQQNDGSDASIFKVSNSGSLLACTYFGGNRDETVNGLVIFRKQLKQYIVIAGLTKTPGSQFPVKEPMQTLLNGNNNTDYYDAYIAVLNDPATAQQKLMFSTLLGGSAEEGQKTGASYHPVIALGPGNELYFSVATTSTDFNNVIGNSFQHLINNYNGGSDAFLAKLINVDVGKQYDCPDQLKAVMGPAELYGEEYALSILPNPFENQFTAVVRSATEEQCIIQIFNSYGNTVLETQTKIISGKNDIVLELSNEPAGFYLLRIITGKKLMQQRMLKQN